MRKVRFGKAFPDELARISVKTKHFFRGRTDQDWQESLYCGPLDQTTNFMGAWRRVLFSIVVIVFFSILSIRLFSLQAIEGKKLRELADSNRIQVRLIHAPRGVIYDRNGKILAQNEPGFRLIEKNQTQVEYLTYDEALKMEVEGDQRFKDLEIDSNRYYPLGSSAAHILGYVGEVTSEELRDNKFTDYKLGDKIGRGGVEQTYEKVLRGIDGGEVIEVDAQGRKVRTLQKKEATPGQNLYLTIDIDLQNKSYDKLEEALRKAQSCCGALIAQDPGTGQILSLVSIPSFDPQSVEQFLAAPNSPFLNRAIAGVYPPGSTFKIVSSLAGLSSEKIKEDTKFEDTGVIFLGPFEFTNWYFTQYGKKEGLVDIVKALKRSNDTFFYRVGQLIGEKLLADEARKLGLGKKLGIDLPGEETGLIPDNDWKVKNIGEVWFPGDTLHMVIGQGFVLTTPLQVSNLISIIASDGKQFPPFLAYKITDPTGKLVKQFKFDIHANSQKFEGVNLSLVKKGLSEAAQNGGTAWPFFSFPIPTAGKTGTAEYGDVKNRTHAWYASFAPVNDPKIATVVLVEGGGEGSSVAAPVAKEIYRWYFSPDKNNLIKDIYPVASESARTLGE